MIRALVVVVLLAGCGGSATTTPAVTDATVPAAPTSAGTACPPEVTALLSDLQNIRSRLSTGMNFESYTQAVGDAVVARDAIEVSLEGEACITDVGIPAEAALLLYADALNAWNACVVDATPPECETTALDTALQDLWVQAEDKIVEAEDALEGTNDQ